MSRSSADALCLRCGQPFRWIIGNPRVCPLCLKKERQEGDSDDKENKD